MENLKIITTSDGSHSLLNTILNETYHSHHGAVQESTHVFIDNGLKFWQEKNPGKPVHVFEVGFGTGLNALLSIEQASLSSSLFSYTSIEAFPLVKEMWSQLNYAHTPEAVDIYNQLHSAPWNESIKIQSNIEFTKLHTTLQQLNLDTCYYDVVFFDAFAPNKQPEMWELPIIKKVADAMKAGGVFVTYCAKGQLKRDLKTAGLEVQTLPGPPGKKEMVRAIKIL
jgi:tRNA U34 5-methylaminomethyl-2-thiouridine-forming methyltransferase MnmC